MKLIINFNSDLLLKYTISELFDYKKDFENLINNLYKLNKKNLTIELYNDYIKFEKKTEKFINRHEEKLKYFKKYYYSIKQKNITNKKELIKYIDNYDDDFNNYYKIYLEIIEILK